MMIVSTWRYYGLLCRSIYQIVAEASGVGVPKVKAEEQSRFVAHFSA
jgi:hypothetical protein